MESFLKIIVPVIISLSLMMILSTASYSGYGQPVANTTTTIANTTAPDISNQTNQNVSQLVQPSRHRPSRTTNTITGKSN